MQRYNIALLPEDEKIQELLVTLSRTHFLPFNDDYILGPEGLAHVTICQFHADTLAQAKDAFNSFVQSHAQGTFSVTVTEFRIRPGTHVNAGYFIAEYAVDKEPALMSLQGECVRHLAEKGISSLTPSASYAPHFTLARVSAVTPTQPQLDDVPHDKLLRMRLALGLSTESGVFLSEVPRL